MPVKNCHKQSGAMLITTALFFIVLIGFAAVTIDVGHLLITRNELQNAADAAALAGANCLNKQPDPDNPTADCIVTALKTGPLSWSIAQNKSYAAIGMNKGDGATLTDGTVSTGYKNVADSILNPTVLMPTALSPVTCNVTTPGAPCYKPAVMVNITKSAGNNGGPVQLLITSMYGGAVVPISVKAVAVLSAPGNVLPGTLIPLVINKCMFDQYWDAAANAPYPATSMFHKNVPQTLGEPWRIRIKSAYSKDDTCQAGQWTTFSLTVPSEDTIRDLIGTGNPTPLAIGDVTWIAPGDKAPNYRYLIDHDLDTDVTVIVVDLPTGLDVHGPTDTPIFAFAGFHIDFITKNPEKEKDEYGNKLEPPLYYIEGHFVKGTTTNGSGGIGPFYGTYTPARLAQ